MFGAPLPSSRCAGARALGEPIVEELVAIFTKDEGKRESKRERVPAAE